MQPPGSKVVACHLKLENIELMAPLDCEKQVLEKYPSFKQKLTITLMSFNKGRKRYTQTKKREKLWN